MREIKFRAWHKCEKKMLNLTKINFLSGAAWSDPESKPHIMCYTNPECCILMQFTGLHDKNGKEIYEGDIANIKYKKVLSIQPTDDPKIYVDGDVLEYVERGVMQFNEKNGQFSFLCKDSLLEDEHIGLMVEIIGNIYESPELLEQPLGNGAEPIRNISEDDRRKNR